MLFTGGRNRAIQGQSRRMSHDEDVLAQRPRQISPTHPELVIQNQIQQELIYSAHAHRDRSQGQFVSV